MPKRNSKRGRRSKRRSRRNTGNTSVIANPYAGPLGRTFKTTLAYSEPTISLNATTGLMADFVFRANSVHDPSFTGTGHQPLGYDQIKLMYDHWVVIASKIIVTFVNTATQTMACGVSVTDSVTSLVSTANTVENGASKYVILGPIGSSSDTKTITYQINPNKFLGRSHPMSDPDLKGGSSDPVEQAFWHVWGGSVTGGDPGQIQASTYLEYTTVFIEPKQLGPS